MKCEAGESGSSCGLLSPSHDEATSLLGGGDGGVNVVRISEEQLQSHIEADCAAQLAEQQSYGARHLADFTAAASLGDAKKGKQRRKSGPLDLRHDSSAIPKPAASHVSNSWLGLLSGPVTSQQGEGGARGLTGLQQSTLADVQAKLRRSADDSSGIASPIHIFPQNNALQQQQQQLKQSKDDSNPFMQLPLSFPNHPMSKVAALTVAQENRLFPAFVPGEQSLASPSAAPVATIAPMPYFNTATDVINAAAQLKAFERSVNQSERGMASPQSPMSPQPMQQLAGGPVARGLPQLPANFNVYAAAAAQAEQSVSAAERKKRSVSLGAYAPAKAPKRKFSG